MPKEEWGIKRVCPTTGKRFYDLNRSPIVSPYSGEVVEIESTSARSMRPDAEDAETKKLQAAHLEDDDVLDDDDVDVTLDDDVLDDDDSDNVSLDELADVSANDDE